MSHDPKAVVPVQQGQGAGTSYNPFAYYWSSAAVSFAAIMELLKVSQEAYNDMAEMSVKTSVAQGNAYLAGAAATQATYNDDASTTRFQMGEQWASCGTSVLGAAGSGLAMKFSNVNQEQTNLKNITSIENEAKGLNGADLVQRQNNNLQGLTPENQQRLDEVRASIRNGNFDYAKQVSRGGDLDSPVLDSRQQQIAGAQGPVTLRQVLETEFTAQNKSAIMKNLSAERGRQTKNLNNEYTGLQGTQQGLKMATDGINTGISATLKDFEAKVAEQKGADSADQARASAGQEFMREANKSQQDQFSQFTQQATQAFKTISELVTVDAKV